jgi:ATP-dependent DNA helicase 2 subunit 2
MADKEASIYIVDVGRSTGTIRNGREQSDLDWAMRWVWDKITTTVAMDRVSCLCKSIHRECLGSKAD